MKIISLQAQNIKRLVAVEIRPDGNLVEITGKNGQGKTSVLDAIYWALAGKRPIQAEPIRKGEKKGVIRLDIGDYKITRTFNRQEDGDYTTGLKVERADGSILKKEQDVLTSLLSALTFDPLDFTRRSPAEQFDLLKGFVSGIDFDALARDDEKDREARRIAKSRAEDLRAQAGAITLPPGKLPKRVDVAGLTQKLADAAGQNATIDQHKRGRANDQIRVGNLREKAAELRSEAEALEREAQDLEQKISVAQVLPEPIDVSQTQADITEAVRTNAILDSAARRADLEAQAQAKEEEAEALTTKIKERETSKQAAISASAMPVRGIEFGDKMIRLNGQPFNQASDAQQLRASVAIAAAMNPELRVIRVREGSRLDEDALVELGQFADEHDMQIWIETVGAGPGGFVIEDGRLQGDPAAEPETVLAGYGDEAL